MIGLALSDGNSHLVYSVKKKKKKKRTKRAKKNYDEIIKKANITHNSQKFTKQNEMFIFLTNFSDLRSKQSIISS